MYSIHLLGALPEMRKVPISFVISACTAIHIEHLGSHSKFFMKFYFFTILRKYVEKFQVLLQYYKNNEYFTRRRMYFWDSTSLNST